MNLLISDHSSMKIALGGVESKGDAARPKSCLFELELRCMNRAVS
jgi:hypothetical protein